MFFLIHPIVDCADFAISMYNSVEIINCDTALLIKSDSTKLCQTMPSSNSQTLKSSQHSPPARRELLNDIKS